MKSFFQLSEQVKKYRQKLLKEADADMTNQEAEPAQAQANQQIQNDQGKKQEPKSTSYAEIPDIDLVTDFQNKFDALAKDKTNAAALVKMKEIQHTQPFAQAFTNAQAELQKAVAAMQAEDKEEKAGKKIGNAGSNTTGSGTTAPPPPSAPTQAGLPAFPGQPQS